MIKTEFRPDVIVALVQVCVFCLVPTKLPEIWDAFFVVCTDAFFVVCTDAFFVVCTDAFFGGGGLH